MIHLRTKLIAQKPDEKKLRKITILTEQIIASFDSQDITPLIEEIIHLSELDSLDEDYFRHLHSHSSIEEFAAMAALPRAEKVSDLKYEELIEITRRAMKVQSWDAEYYMELLDKNVPMPEASSLIFHPPENYDGDIGNYCPTPEEIVNWATSRNQTIQL